MYHDALDVLAQGGPDELFECISAAFCGRGLDPAHGVYFLGERSLWPPSCRYVVEGRSWCNDHPDPAQLPVYPNLTEPGGSAEYRFVNSGLYAGSVPALHALLGASLGQANETGSVDDQELLNDLPTNFGVWRRRFALDTRQACFGSAHRSTEYYAADKRDERGRWRNSLTGGSPLLLHFNGGGKELMPVALGSSPGSALSWPAAGAAGGGGPLASAQVLLWGTGPHNAAAVPMAELCADAPLVRRRRQRRRR